MRLLCLAATSRMCGREASMELEPPSTQLQPAPRTPGAACVLYAGARALACASSPALCSYIARVTAS